MRKVINNTLRIFVISAVLISAALMFIVYYILFHHYGANIFTGSAYEIRI